MFSKDQYELIDFGEGRKLERFGSVVVDRPCPTASEIERVESPAWAHAEGVFERRSGNTGVWHWAGERAERLASRQNHENEDEQDLWRIAYPSGRRDASHSSLPDISFHLRSTPAGQVGVFPEQAPNWDWIADQVVRVSSQLTSAGRSEDPDVIRPRVLNLFAYTGGSTLSAAAAGAAVVHVDGAKNVVNWARNNAKLSGMNELPIRWIAEDAQRFVTRELKRGNRYHGIILDPPSYGHGPQGQPWRIHDHLEELLCRCFDLTCDDNSFLLLTCHTSDLERDELQRLWRRANRSRQAGSLRVRPMSLTSSRGQSLPSGYSLQWIGHP